MHEQNGFATIIQRVVKMKSPVVLLLLLGSVFAKDWWEGGNFYQVYPRSFQDSDGDGIGDLKGVTQRIQYLKDIGMDAVWLSPIFKSPMSDFGYDISDYYQIQPEYGTVEDLEELIEKAREIGLKIILDFVPNHTSDEHEWFKKSVRREGIYTDFYIWEDGRPNPNNASARNLPPNNWNCEFRYSAWEWNEERQQYYYHQFGVFQPDLNYRNPNVVAAMEEVLKYWLHKGIGGFRVDAVPYLYEHQDNNGNYPNEPINRDCADPDDFCNTIHIYMKDQPETFDLVYSWRKVVDEFTKEQGGDTRILMTEAYTSLENIVHFYGDGKRNGSNIPFNFEMIETLSGKNNARDFAYRINRYLSRVPKDMQPNWVLGNHDNKRISTRFGEDRRDLINILLQTLPGVAITYYGEEIGMTDVNVSWEDTVDPQACGANPNNYVSYSRDPARGPFQWDDSQNAGFSNASRTWLPVNTDFKNINVKAEEQDPISHLNIFKALTTLRKEPTFTSGSFEQKALSNDILIYQRVLEGSDTYFVVMNFGSKTQVVDAKSAFPNLGERAEVVVSSTQSQLRKGRVVPTNSIRAQPSVATVFKSL